MIEGMRRLFGRGKINTIADDGNAQRAQVQLSAAQIRDNSPVQGLFGVISNPPDGSDVVWLAHGGDAANVTVIATNHPESRFKNAPRGAGGVYDQAGSYILLGNDTSIIIKAKCGTTLLLGADGSITATPANGILTVNGQVKVTGNVVAGFGGADQVTLQHHTHPTAEPGGPSQPTPGG